jgi:hypothetical protein
MEKKKFILLISLIDSDADTVDILALNESYIRDDIDQLAWNLCNCDAALQAKRFSSLELINYKAEVIEPNVVQFTIEFSVITDKEGFIYEVISEYMDGFTDYLRDVENGLYSRTGNRTKLNLNNLNYDLTIISSA